MTDEHRIYATPPTLQRFFAGRRSERVERRKKQSAIDSLSGVAVASEASNYPMPTAGTIDAATAKGKSTKKRNSSPYRITDTPRYVMAGLADLVGKARSPSISRRSGKHESKNATAAGHSHVEGDSTLANKYGDSVACASTPPTPPRGRHSPSGIRTTPLSPRKDVLHLSELPIPIRRTADVGQKVTNWKDEETVVSNKTGDNCHSKKQGTLLPARCSQQLASVSPIIRVQYSNESISSLKDSAEGRNLLNKKEPPNTIKETSESAATLDEQDADKASKTLSHENTVVRVETNTKPQAQQQPKAAVSDNVAASRTSPLPAQKQEIVRVTQQLLDSISCKDYDTYSKLCDAGMTCFEPESMGNLIEGMDFHKFYFENATNPRTSKIHTTMLNPSVHILGDDGACIAYIRLTQYIDKNGEARSRQSEETRVWQKRNGRGWVCVHVHRTGAPSSVNTASQD